MSWPGPGSHLIFLMWVLCLTAILPAGQMLLLLTTVLLFGLLNGGRGLSPLRRARFWITILSIIAISPWILGQADEAWGPWRLSREGLVMGLEMALRATCLLLAFSVSIRGLSPGEMVRLFEGVGLKGLGFALGVALNLLTTLGATIEAAYHTIRLRGGHRRPWLALKLLLITTIANALRYGDDVVKAASARGFDPAMPRRATPLFRRADGAFALGLLGLTGMLLLWPW